MQEYICNASEENGHLVRVRIYADDRADLIAQLSLQGLFLVSCTVVEEEPPAAPPPNVTPVRRIDEISAPTRKLTPFQRLFLSGILVLGLVIGLGRAYRQWHPSAKNALVEERLSRLQAGMRRGDVELYLGQPAHERLNPQRSYYFVPPDTLIGIMFDQTEGPGHPENRIATADFEVIREADWRG